MTISGVGHEHSKVAHHFQDDAPETDRAAYRSQTLPMYEVSERLRPLVDKHGLQRNVEEMRDQGWTVMTDVPLGLTNRIRERILALGEDAPFGEDHPGFQRVLRTILDKDPVFIEAATYPPLLVMAEYLVGARCLLSEAIATIKYPGGRPLGLHTDQPLMPTPYPEHMGFFTSCWALDYWDQVHGSTMVVPDSHKLRRYPEADEAKDHNGMSIEAPAGSIVLWGGFTWHDSGPRSVPGERVVLHLSYARQCYTPNNDFRRLLGREAIESASPELAALLGEGLPYGTYNLDGPGIIPERLGETVVAARAG